MKVEILPDKYLTVKVLTPNLMCLQSFETLLNKAVFVFWHIFLLLSSRTVENGFKKTLHLYLAFSFIEQNLTSIMSRGLCGWLWKL